MDGVTFNNHSTAPSSVWKIVEFLDTDAITAHAHVIHLPVQCALFGEFFPRERRFNSINIPINTICCVSIQAILYRRLATDCD